MKKQEKFILALDQGTTSSRAILFNKKGGIVAISQKAFKQHFPQSGWVEHDSLEIWNSQLFVAKDVLKKAKITSKDLASIGITNQRETTIVWDKKTGKPIYNAIVWQDRRTSDFCNSLKDEHTSNIQKKTGLMIDAYFSATKIKWILDNVKGARIKAEAGELLFGTIDTWLIYNFSQGKSHLTDVTNASRTMLFNTHKLEWDKELLELFTIPKSMLPTVKSCSELFCNVEVPAFKGVPISGVAGDQQAALFGQLCTEQGMVKTTYGTGCFMMMNTGEQAVISKNKLLTTIAWQLDGKVNYALEGSVFVGGAAIQWLRDGLRLFKNSKESEKLAKQVEDNGGVYFVPALTGLGAPYWNQEARGAFFGITRGTTTSHFCRAALEAIAFQVNDVLKAMETDYQQKVPEIRVDGGAVENNLLMQFQSDITRTAINRPKILESTALGAAYFAGLAVGFWKNTDELKKQWKSDKTFIPTKNDEKVTLQIHNWKKAVKSTIDFGSGV